MKFDFEVLKFFSSWFFFLFCFWASFSCREFKIFPLPRSVALNLSQAKKKMFELFSDNRNLNPSFECNGYIQSTLPPTHQVWAFLAFPRIDLFYQQCSKQKIGTEFPLFRWCFWTMMEPSDRRNPWETKWTKEPTFIYKIAGSSSFFKRRAIPLLLPSKPISETYWSLTPEVCLVWYG